MNVIHPDVKKFYMEHLKHPNRNFNIIPNMPPSKINKPRQLDALMPKHFGTIQSKINKSEIASFIPKEYREYIIPSGNLDFQAGGHNNGYKQFKHDLGRSIKSIGHDLSEPLKEKIKGKITGGKRNAFKQFTHDIGRSIKSIGYDLGNDLNKSVRKVGTKAIDVGTDIAISKLNAAQKINNKTGKGRGYGLREIKKPFMREYTRDHQVEPYSKITGLVAGARIKKPRIKSQKMEARGQLLAKIMNERNMTLGQASKFIKESNMQY
jgi:hypothetical protein